MVCGQRAQGQALSPPRPASAGHVLVRRSVGRNSAGVAPGNKTAVGATDAKSAPARSAVDADPSGLGRWTALRTSPSFLDYSSGASRMFWRRHALGLNPITPRNTRQ
jgi:hypothetical protein